MEAMRHILEGDLDGARKILEQIPEEGTEDLLLKEIQLGGLALSDLARAERGNRAQRRAAAKQRAHQ